MWLPIRSHAMLLRALPCKARYWGSAARTLAAAVNEPQQPALMRLWADYWPRQATSSANSSFQTTRSICSSTAHSEKLAAENRAEFKEEGPVLQLDAAADEENCFLKMGLSPKLAEKLASKRTTKGVSIGAVTKSNDAMMAAKVDVDAARKDARTARKEAEFMKPGLDVAVAAVHEMRDRVQTLETAAQVADAASTQAGESVDSAFQQPAAGQRDQSSQSREIDELKEELSMTVEHLQRTSTLLGDRAELDNEEDSMLYSTTIDMQEGRAAEKQRRTELWARWAEANPDKAAEMAERLAVSMQNLPRRVAEWYEELRDPPTTKAIATLVFNNARMKD